MTAAREAMLMIERQVHAYFKAASGDAGASFDATAINPPAAGWIDAGWVANEKRSAATGIEALRAGVGGGVVKQVTTNLEARLEFDFQQWGKLQMALAARGTAMNVLEATGAAVALDAGSTATALKLSSTVGFAAGDLVAVDVDYANQAGAIGTGLPAVWVTAGQVANDADFVRRVTLNVARVAEVNSTGLGLAQALPGGAPAAGAKAQKVLGFVDREGGSYFPEWSALLVVEGENGGWLSYYYPRLQAAAPMAETSREFAAPLATVALHASFRALPQADARDGQQVVCCRTYMPAAGAAVY